MLIKAYLSSYQYRNATSAFQGLIGLYQNISAAHYFLNGETLCLDISPLALYGTF